MPPRWAAAGQRLGSALTTRQRKLASLGIAIALLMRLTPTSYAHLSLAKSSGAAAMYAGTCQNGANLIDAVAAHGIATCAVTRAGRMCPCVHGGPTQAANRGVTICMPCEERLKVHGVRGSSMETIEHNRVAA